MTFVNRISTNSAFNQTLRDVTYNQRSIYNLQDQISSGLKSRDFEGLDGEVEHFINLEARIGRTKAYEQNNVVAISRLETTGVALDDIVKVVDEMQDILTTRRSSSAQNMNFPQQFDQRLESIANTLNMTFEGRYLFGGTRTNVPPVIIQADGGLPDNVEEGVPDTSYYQGSSEDITLRADENIEVIAGVRADEDAFQKIVAAAKLAQAGHAEDNDTKLKAAFDMLTEGLQGVISIQTDNNNKKIYLNDVNQRHENLRLYWKGVSEQISRTDIVAASSQFSMDQAILQASFQSFARITQLKLTDYLR